MSLFWGKRGLWGKVGKGLRRRGLGREVVVKCCRAVGCCCGSLVGWQRGLEGWRRRRAAGYRELRGRFRFQEQMGWPRNLEGCRCKLGDCCCRLVFRRGLEVCCREPAAGSHRPEGAYREQ